MKHLNIKISLTLFLMGLIGIFSLLCSPFPLSILPKEALKEAPVHLIPYLMLVNPSLLLCISIAIGHMLAHKVQLQAPLLTNIFLKKEIVKTFTNQLCYGALLGIGTGIFVIALSKVSLPYLPEAFVDMPQKFPQSLWTKFLYGGITEEILLRWGIMTLIVWILWQATGATTPTRIHYYLGIAISSLIFGLMHLPMVLLIVRQPTIFLVAYIVVLNAIFGCTAGWLFWKKGIEASMFAHIACHITFAISL